MHELKVFLPHDIREKDLRGAHQGSTVSSLHGNTMGTFWNLHWHHPKAKSAKPEISHELIATLLHGVFDLVIRQMSHYDPNSELSQFNRLPPKTPLSVSRDFLNVLQRALEISQLTQGAYNPNLGRLSAAYGFGPEPSEGCALPKDPCLDPWNKIHFERNGTLLWHELHPPQLDLSSIAKGYTLDLVADALSENGIENFLFEIGGEFKARGCKPNAHPWWIELPSENTAIPTLRFGLTRHALATSGKTPDPDQFRNGPHDAPSLANSFPQIHHLMDPREGKPARHSLHHTTVLAADCMEADAWATALFVLGKEEGHTLAEFLNLAVIFTDAESHTFSSEMESMMQDEA